MLMLFNMYIAYNKHCIALEKLLLVTFTNGAVKYSLVPLPQGFSLILNHSHMYNSSKLASHTHHIYLCYNVSIQK